MNITTKFNLGQKVWFSFRVELAKIYADCICDRTHYIEHKGLKLLCPQCSGRDVVKEYVFGLCPSAPSVIGMINVEIYDKPFLDTDSGYLRNYVGYMLKSTCVGIGTVHREDNIFGSLEEAVDFCEKENKKNGVEDEVSIRKLVESWDNIK